MQPKRHRRGPAQRRVVTVPCWLPCRRKAAAGAARVMMKSKVPGKNPLSPCAHPVASLSPSGRGRRCCMPLDLSKFRPLARGINPWTPPVITEHGLPAWIAVNLLATALYFLLAMVVSRFFAAYGLFPAPIWLPTGVAMVAAMIGGVYMLPGIFLGSFLANDLLFAPPLHITAIISATNALGPVVGAIVLLRLRPKSGLFTAFSGVIAFLVCTTFLSPAISATGGAIAMTIGQPFDPSLFYSIWVNWWLTDSGGTLYLAPALILWLGIERESDARLGGGKHGGFCPRGHWGVGLDRRHLPDPVSDAAVARKLHSLGLPLPSGGAAVLDRVADVAAFRLHLGVADRDRCHRRHRGRLWSVSESRARQPAPTRRYSRRPAGDERPDHRGPGQRTVRGGEREQSKIDVSGEDQPRIAHAAQRHHRFFFSARRAGGRAACQREPACGLRPSHQFKRPAPSCADRRSAGDVEDRGGAHRFARRAHIAVRRDRKRGHDDRHSGQGQVDFRAQVCGARRPHD